MGENSEGESERVWVGAVEAAARTCPLALPRVGASASRQPRCASPQLSAAPRRAALHVGNSASLALT